MKRVMAEKDYMAQDDARTLARAAAIKKDKPRLKKAVGAAKGMAEEEMSEARSMAKIAKIITK